MGRNLLDLERRAFGANHPRVQGVLYNLAAIAALSHQTDKALSLLSEALQHPSTAAEDVEVVRKDKDMDGIRADPRFAALLASASRR